MQPTREDFRALFEAMREPIGVQSHPGAPEEVVGHEAVRPEDFGAAVLRQWGCGDLCRLCSELLHALEASPVSHQAQWTELIARTRQTLWGRIQ